MTVAEWPLYLDMAASHSSPGIFVLTLRKVFLMKNMTLLKMLLLTVAYKNMEIILHHKVKINFILSCFIYLNL